jgi:cysteine desulfurase
VPRVLTLPIYLDAHATTPCDPRVVEAMLPFFTEKFGNAASRQHPFGWAAREATDEARGQIARLIGAKVKDIIFTSGATESNNLAIKGIAEACAPKPEGVAASDAPGDAGDRAAAAAVVAAAVAAGRVESGQRAGPVRTGRHIVTVVTEHRAVLDPCAWLEQRGFEVTRLPVQPDGLIDLGQLEAALRDDTILVSVMAANNETGVLQPLAAIGTLTSARGIAFHTDAAQAAGTVPLDVEAIRADLVSLTAHKLHGPKGVGALYVRRRGPAATLAALIHGGGHERGLRSGTLNTPAIAGFGAAAAICAREMPVEAQRLAGLRDRLLAGLRANLPDVTVNGSLSARLPHSLNVSFAHVDGAALLMSMTDIAVSSGAACSSASAEPSHVLSALGLPDALAKASLRFGLTRCTTADEIDYAITRVTAIVSNLRTRRQISALR